MTKKMEKWKQLNIFNERSIRCENKYVTELLYFTGW